MSPYFFQTTQLNTAGFRTVRLAVHMTDVISVVTMHLHYRQEQLAAVILCLGSHDTCFLNSIGFPHAIRQEDPSDEPMQPPYPGEHSKLACMIFLSFGDFGVTAV